MVITDVNLYVINLVQSLPIPKKKVQSHILNHINDTRTHTHTYTYTHTHTLTIDIDIEGDLVFTCTERRDKRQERRQDRRDS